MIALPKAFLETPLAHRALHDVTQGRPENSRTAVRAAIQAGYGIEIDVQLSSDGAAMVFHDYDLARLAHGKGAVRLATADSLGSTPLRHGEEGIPTLPEVLDLVAGQIPILIEIKDQDGQMGPNVGPLEEATAAALKSYDGLVAVMSFNPHAVARMAQLLPDTPRGLTTAAYRADDWPTLNAKTRTQLASIPDYDRVGASFISHDIKDLDTEPVAAVRARGGHILCWTVRSPDAEREARKFAQNITFEGYAAPHPVS